jgi:hypothetical protein
MRSVLAVLLTWATTLAGQTPIAIDSGVARQLAIEWHNAAKPSQDIACLYGHVEGDTVVVDAQVLLPGSPITGCPDLHKTLIGTVGFIDPTNPPVSQDDVLAAMCHVLAKQIAWLVAGEVYGIVPAMFPDGHWHPAGSVWACVRAPAKKAST